MAERRMFAKSIVLSDAFLDMPLGARCLYMTMGMLADDDGFVNSPKSIIRQCGASEDDMRILITKKFVIPFDNGVIVIKHWRINNYLRSDRYQPTTYLEEKKQLNIDENNAYTLSEDTLISTDSGIPSIGIPSIDKNRLEKNRLDNSSSESTTMRTTKSRFVKPSIEEVQKYFWDKGGSHDDAERFYDYYESNGWTIGRQAKKMSDWKAAVRNWLRNDFGKPQKKLPDREMKPIQVEVPEMDEERKQRLKEIYGEV